jgi:hypothetical protein
MTISVSDASPEKKRKRSRLVVHMELIAGQWCLQSVLVATHDIFCARSCCILPLRNIHPKY